MQQSSIGSCVPISKQKQCILMCIQRQMKAVRSIRMYAVALVLGKHHDTRTAYIQVAHYVFKYGIMV